MVIEHKKLLIYANSSARFNGKIFRKRVTDCFYITFFFKAAVISHTSTGIDHKSRTAPVTANSINFRVDTFKRKW